MARDNPTWGAERIRGELLKLGIAVSKASVQRYRRRGPARPPSQTWATFLRNHHPTIWAADLLTVQTLTFRTLYVLVFVSHARRELVHLNVTASPTAAWVWRQLIAATPWGRAPRYLVRDRDTVYGRDFAQQARRLGIETLVTPLRAPKANAVAERWVRTVRNECLDHVLVFGRRHLEQIVRDYVTHYNAERPHRSLALATPAGAHEARGSPFSDILRRDVVGGLIHEYYAAAA
jgi:transposase InsO family protein